MIDSGTPSTTEPTTMPIAPPVPSLPKRRSTMRSPPRNTVAPTISRRHTQLEPWTGQIADSMREIANPIATRAPVEVRSSS